MRFFKTHIMIDKKTLYCLFCSLLTMICGGIQKRCRPLRQLLGGEQITSGLDKPSLGEFGFNVVHKEPCLFP